MSNSLSITLHDRVFQCPNCKETINTSAQRCPFCSHVIDSGTAQVAADFMARVNQACNDARNLRTMAGAIPILFALSFVMSSFKMQTVVAIFVVFGAAIRWRVRFGSLEIDDRDLENASRTVGIVLWVCGALAALTLAVNLQGLFTMLWPVPKYR